MSSKRVRDADAEPATPALDQEQVAGWLSAHPDFFERHPEVLEALNLHHRVGGKAVSLIEHQVQRLRERNRQLQGRLKALLDTARENESRVLHLQDLARALIVARNLTDVFKALDAGLRRDFSVDAVFLGLKRDAPRESGLPGLHYLTADDAVVGAFRDFFRQPRPVCGPLSERQLSLLFPGEAELLKSAAVMPLGKPVMLGMLVVASREPKRFRPDIGTLFLELIADLVAAAALVHLGQEPAQG
ncbi:MAG TPA: DUF484 family protein [Nevskiales bacterium]|nr:DUF484 family protein [Nevskiales bacterium]